MAIYSIKDLEKLSGIKSHTIRIWEQRYDILRPQRTKTNIRFYQEEDLKLLLNIALLNRNGIKISKISKMSPSEIAEKATDISVNNYEHSTQIDALTISMIEMDEYKFDQILSSNIRKLGFERTIIEVIYPFLEKLSLLWLTGSINPVQENFFSYLIRQKVIVAIDSEPIMRGDHVKKYMIYLPEGESQELSLLLMHYILKSRRNQVIYLGQNIGLEDLKDANKIHKPDFVFTMITEAYSKQPVGRYVDQLSKVFKDAHLLLSGYQVAAQNIKNTAGITVLSSLEETIKFVDDEKSIASFIK